MNPSDTALALGYRAQLEATIKRYSEACAVADLLLALLEGRTVDGMDPGTYVPLVRDRLRVALDAVKADVKGE